MTGSGEPAAVVVVRAWLDDNHLPRLRARITIAPDAGSAEVVNMVAAGVDGICDTVRELLTRFLSPAATRLASPSDRD